VLYCSVDQGRDFGFNPVELILQTTYPTARRRRHGPKAHRYLVLYRIPMINLVRTKVQFQNVEGTAQGSELTSHRTPAVITHSLHSPAPYEMGDISSFFLASAGNKERDPRRAESTDSLSFPIHVELLPYSTWVCR
jgi:hypothetical protein